MKTLLLISLYIVPTLCFATLGQNRASVSNDIRVLGAQALVGENVLSTHPEVHVDGVKLFSQIIKEYSDANGDVFAITWSGPTHPDLHTLLANYYPEFKRLEDHSLKGHRYTRTPHVTSEITVVRGGHLGNFRGVAYINGRLPKGITLGDLK